ncbi:SGNH/GDSL hydrolase family protein [Prosthecomicrobium pneumaticum]|uniref:Lysophospholipase L1-like esterase n=1 Tax=Prosthecomicrobium pneumaticum TaxID=81895 RepID=A0A7W9FPC5_9HYPH|nr:SGNH/GDSL hydrolase family protein [Prosthecomicrobium pneumaticum]MBB5754293.1 lysophospholipase L1-like esterase [Prosthecomicrobium pneumaticum]
MKSVLCFGDSNTWGSSTVPPEPGGRYAPDIRWPGVLRAALGTDWTVVEEGLPARTTVHADPVEGSYMSGAAYFLPCLRSHRPLDVVVIMLGTNDLKARFALQPLDIAAGVGQLLRILEAAECGVGGGVPKALVVCPPPLLADMGTGNGFPMMFAGGYEKSLALLPHYEKVCAAHGAALLDAGAIIASSRFDGLHLDPEAHATLGRAVAARVAALV